jgi:hypothetical protein
MINSTSTIAGDPALGTTSFGYDALSRLTGYTPPTDPTNKSQTFAWNSMPDRASKQTGTAPALTTCARRSILGGACWLGGPTPFGPSKS